MLAHIRQDHNSPAVAVPIEVEISSPNSSLADVHQSFENIDIYLRRAG